MDSVSFANPPAYMTPAKKCPRVDSSGSPSNIPSTIHDPTSLLSTPTKELAKLLLEHASFVEELSPGSPSTRELRILQAARENDIKWKLSPSKTIIQPKPIVRPPVPEVYTHSHPDWYKNDIFAATQKDSDMLAAHRIFLDCFVGECGFVPYHKRTDGGIHSLSIFTNFVLAPGAWTKKPPLTEEEKKKYDKWGSVVNKIPEIPGMNKQDAIFLVGRLAGRDKLNLAHHQMSVRAVAVQLERLCKSVQDEKQGKERINAIHKAFKFLTGYHSFEEAYKNEREDRWMTSTGMGVNPKKKFAVLFDTNTLDETQLDALGGDITDDEI